MWYYSDLPRQPAQQAGTVQKRMRRRAKKTPQPTRLGPISFSSRVWKPLSPMPTKVMTSPMQTCNTMMIPRLRMMTVILTMPRPTYRITLAEPLPSNFSPSGRVVNGRRFPFLPAGILKNRNRYYLKLNLIRYITSCSVTTKTRHDVI